MFQSAFLRLLPIRTLPSVALILAPGRVFPVSERPAWNEPELAAPLAARTCRRPSDGAVMLSATASASAQFATVMLRIGVSESMLNSSTLRIRKLTLSRYEFGGPIVMVHGPSTSFARNWRSVPVTTTSPTRLMSRSDSVPMDPLTTMSPTAAPLTSEVIMSDDFEFVP